MQPVPQPEPPWAERLYDECAARLVVYGRALGLDHAEAEDVLHDTFRAVLALRERPVQPAFYLVRSFRNRALNHRRSLWRRLSRELESRGWFEQDGGETPAERAAVAGLETLPTEQREVIVLKLWHDLTYEAIGEMLGISPNTAAGRYRYGLAKLRTLLQAEPQPESGGPELLPAHHPLGRILPSPSA